MTQYTVKSGDWVSKIAVAFYGTYLPINGWDPVQAIAKANPQVVNINAISPGQVLNIPDKPGTSVATSTSSSTGTAQVATSQTGSGASTLPAAQSSGVPKWMIYTGVGLLAAGLAIGAKKYMAKRKAKKAA